MADSAPSSAREPSLKAVRVPGVLLRRVLRVLRLSVVMAVLVGGTVGLAASGHLGLPFQQVTTLTGRLASVGDLFEDPEMIRLLRKHGLRVHTISAGSREVATGSLDGLDFAFPSGKSAADQLHAERQAAGQYSNDSEPFYSPLVLATYREYAETLVDKDVAVRRGSTQKPLYYSLGMSRFVELANTAWHDIGITEHGVDNHNLVLARTSDICQSNSADSYLGLLAFTLNGERPIKDASEIPGLAARLKELILRQGSPGTDLSTKYESSAGPSTAPVVVMYEHQFLDYQAKYRAEHGRLDEHRVLLYPGTQMVSEPHFVALNHRADRLGDLLKGDPEFRRREARLGYHTFGTDELGTNIAKLHVPDPDTTSTEQTDRTAAQMPDYPLLEQLITSIKSCPPPVSD